MIVKNKILEFDTRGFKPQFFQIRQEVRDFVKESGVKNGIVVVQSPHTTCSVFFEEYVHDFDINGYEYLQTDLLHGLEKVFPKQLTEGVQEYRYPGPKHLDFAVNYHNQKHPETLSDGTLVNGDAHCKASLIGNNVSLAIVNGNILTGEFGYIYFVDWDGNRPRHRKVHIMVMGE